MRATEFAVKSVARVRELCSLDAKNPRPCGRGLDAVARYASSRPSTWFSLLPDQINNRHVPDHLGGVVRAGRHEIAITWIESHRSDTLDLKLENTGDYPVTLVGCMLVDAVRRTRTIGPLVNTVSFVSKYSSQ